MATDNHNIDPLVNPAVDYDRTDLSSRGILVFLVGLLIAGVFIELVMWGMFRFLAHSTLFAQGNPSPMATTQPRAMPEAAPGATLQNLPGNVNVNVFPAPRLQTDDVADMDKFLGEEKKILYPEQPFTDSTGAVHIPINEAMNLIVQRGLPVRPNSPPPDFNAQTEAGNSKITQKEGQTHGQPEAAPSQGAKPGPDHQ